MQKSLVVPNYAIVAFAFTVFTNIIILRVSLFLPVRGRGSSDWLNSSSYWITNRSRSLSRCELWPDCLPHLPPRPKENSTMWLFGNQQNDMTLKQKLLLMLVCFGFFCPFYHWSADWLKKTFSFIRQRRCHLLLEDHSPVPVRRSHGDWGDGETGQSFSGASRRGRSPRTPRSSCLTWPHTLRGGGRRESLDLRWDSAIHSARRESVWQRVRAGPR